ncbi:30S ribosomal protein S16 [candidate division WWE3 bacterium CG_4_9_14_3_um_filter_34_6]|uniref:Small ribosomal subunit protein bS16 n=1 Tax=candidate division WWE3 bacterium CG_4_9_14_3_um_filter_34_6 TaxID=1975079 RepID=A0A2M7X462_UNCKA|nr:MAG: 30S ribosomal protein S16 [candidate division WWE3 bacterium CG_4_9_14_3_um_filter_34_6]
MVRIRLTRVGRKNAPAYRIVIIDRKAKRDGKAIEIIGNYNPTENPGKVNYDKERYEYWISKGAQVSDSVKKLTKGTYKYVKYDAKAMKLAAEATPEPEVKVIENSKPKEE